MILHVLKGFTTPVSPAIPVPLLHVLLETMIIKAEAIMTPDALHALLLWVDFHG